MENNLSGVLRSRRSIRRFKPDPIPPQHIDQILDAARLAPSWCNLQCWRLIVIDDKEIIKSLGKPICETAPVVIAACAVTQDSGVRNGYPYYMLDMGIAIEHMVLQAESLGLGSCWIGYFDEGRAKETLAIPHDIAVVALLPIGYPDESPEPRPRKQLKEISCFNRWDF